MRKYGRPTPDDNTIAIKELESTQSLKTLLNSLDDKIHPNSNKAISVETTVVTLLRYRPTS